VVSDGYHRIHAKLSKDALDAFREEFPGEKLSGTLAKIQQASFEIRKEQADIVMDIKSFEVRLSSSPFCALL